MGAPHALMLPYPAQGHVTPLMELAHCLIDCGFKITFINTEFNHERVMNAVEKKGGDISQIHLVTIPDGLGPGEDHNDLGRLMEAIPNAMPGYLEELIENNNKTEEDKIACLIADGTMAWSFKVAKKMGLRSAAFWPACAGVLATLLSIPKLIDDGIIQEDGTVKRQEMIQLSPGMPAMNTAHFAWNCFSDPKTRKIIFNYMVKNNQDIKTADLIICNTFSEIELPVLTFAPNILPIGPLLLDKQVGKLVGHFWPEDTTCMGWLDEQPANSVIYVAFGSFTIFNQDQFQELALGLELTGRPFLWVVRPDLANEASKAHLHGFRDRVGKRGRMVGWSPQQQVLSHPSIACFLSHCGWNSTIEGVRNGVPFLCWPYFADQFVNESYICDVWRTGVRLSPDESGIIPSKQIKSKVENLLGDAEIKARALAFKEMASISVSKGGSSFENLNRLVDAMRE